MKYAKSEAGQQAFKARSALFSARQRSAFILFDGVKSNEQVLAATGGLGITQDDIDHMVQQGFLLPVPGAVASAASASSAVATGGAEPQALPGSGRSPQERYRDAMPIATKLTAGLGLRGFRLNLAVEGASGFDDLLTLLPKIQDAVGVKACVPLEQALKG
ncbi:MAG: hypothetical protein Q7U13_00480 [Rhodoferax sp.]|nr:hypothetical protein [Rhodoferax sp.]